MSLRKKRLFVALEGIKEETTVALEAAALEAEEEMSEMMEEGRDVASDVENVEEAAEDAETLDKIKDTMEDQVEDGEGMSEDAAEIAEVAIESIYERLGLDTSKVMPAMESFGSSSSRVTATKIAVEGIKETIEKVWTAIKEFFKNIWNKIKMFFAKLTNRRESIEKYIKSVKKASEDLTPSMEKKEDKLKNKGLAKKFSKGGEANYDTAIEIEDTAVKIFGTLDNLASGVESFFKDNFSGGQPTKTNDELESDAISRLQKALSFASVEDTDEYLTLSVSPLPNEGILKINIPKNINKIKITTEITSGEKSAAESIIALDQVQITEALDKALTDIKAAKNYEKTIKTLEDVNKSSIKIADEVIKLATKLDTTEDKELSEKLDTGRSALQSMNTLISKYSSVAPVQAYSAVKALGDYANASIRNYVKKEK